MHTGAIEVKKAMTFVLSLFALLSLTELGVNSNTATVYICHSCQNTHLQPMGRVTEKKSKNDQILLNYHTNSGHPTDKNCDECGGRYQLGGPMWSGPLHDPEFVGKMIDHVKSGDAEYKTQARILGMCTIAQAVRDLFRIVIVTLLKGYSGTGIT